MPDYLNDSELVLLGLLNGVLKWEPAASGSSGELWFDGVRHWINRHDNGMPNIAVSFRRALIEKLAPRSWCRVKGKP